MAILVTLEGIWAHYRSAFTNHSNGISYPAPPRSALLGMAGAALGLTVRELAPWNKVLKMGFMWDSPITESILQIKRYNIKTTVEKNLLDPDEYTKIPTLDSLLYIHHRDIPSRIRGKWLLVVSDQKKEQQIYEALQHPVYPLSFGSSDALAHVVEVKKVTVNKVDGPITTRSSVPCDETLHGQNAIPSDMARYYEEYGKWLELTKVYTPASNEPIKDIIPKFGAYKAEGAIYAIL